MRIASSLSMKLRHLQLASREAAHNYLPHRISRRELANDRFDHDGVDIAILGRPIGTSHALPPLAEEVVPGGPDLTRKLGGDRGKQLVPHGMEWHSSGLANPLVMFTPFCEASSRLGKEVFAPSMTTRPDARLGHHSTAGLIIGSVSGSVELQQIYCGSEHGAIQYSSKHVINHRQLTMGCLGLTSKRGMSPEIDSSNGQAMQEQEPVGAYRSNKASLMDARQSILYKKRWLTHVFVGSSLSLAGCAAANKVGCLDEQDHEH
ncbi:uncharacterized protein LY79DRAFT_694483 [Colletotrichum navitas]|uniref:Uncharacterized protein n=1 Tax=Colletotrichum navitas TaxID=681940 RepID=A0AAD8PRA0_9PEZI|nr:uncharacterized protein LY79DRAFT_694483 [Colletotrichum navitas]KAK1579256.1 hypothetical protein LY79DRAFT_694483 [Colletotrichum navitas]